MVKDKTRSYFMSLLTAIILENEGFSLNDLNMIQRVALKKAYTGRLNIENISDKEAAVLDSLVDLGLLDIGYEVTEDGEKAGRLIDKFSKQERDDITAAKQLNAEQERENINRRRTASPRDNFRFSEGEEAVMKSSGLDPDEIMKIFLGENMLGGLTHYVIDPRNKTLVTAFRLGKCENCKGDVQEANSINIDPEGAKRLRLKRMDYLPAEVTMDDEGDTTYCDDCYDDAHAEPDDEFDDDGEPSGSYDMSDDGDALASAGLGTDEDYGGWGGNHDEW